MSLVNEELKLSANKFYRFNGPCKITIKKGQLEVLGKKFSTNDSIIIKSGKALPIYALETSTISFSGSPDSFCELNESVRNSWMKLLKRILEIKQIKSQVRIIVIGKVDSGKTTLITWLINKLYENLPDTKIGIIDMDMGQGTITPPTTIGLGTAKDYIINIESVELVRMEFIGTTSPSGNLLRCYLGLSNLLRDASEYDFVIIDTTGWVNDSASRAYKTAKIRLINPDLIININEIQNGNVILYPFLIPLSVIYEVFPIEKSRYVYPRDRNTRKNIRENALAKYFLEAKPQKVNYSKIGLLHTRLGIGTPTDNEINEYIEQYIESNVLYSELSSECLFAIINKDYKELDIDFNILRSKFNVCEIRFYNIEDINGIILALCDEKNVLGLGILQKIDFHNKIMEIFTPLHHSEINKIKIIEFGALRIEKNGTELGYLHL